MNSKANGSKPKQAVTCRTCKGAHFSLQCPFRSEMEALRSFMDSTNAGGIDSQTADPMTKAAVQEIAPELNTGRYIPPTLRAAAAAANGVPERRRMEGFSIRVTNLPENTSESDLREIFSRFGDVIRIFPAKDRKTQLNRGFAFISYATQEEAASAIYSANGMHYSHLILKVDWAHCRKVVGILGIAHGGGIVVAKIFMGKQELLDFIITLRYFSRIE
ncbi:Eukaryotic translation initiation factor 3 subunit G-B [Echinococcus granulosus]|uniref:Eukaryotic translation initiation factor 3 subunit G-B n=1 Tax=Echinococcus granulosus TaxID=6210 RepID=W6UP66_ECHGR|nr:Eukaryotic translation initiation factor 3 subunit G-B [Echinococcus granulosus]EUB55219.1 Eukaryotic translation initiation factor 3 subunit G-B [Echinococcus granulosus]